MSRVSKNLFLTIFTFTFLFLKISNGFHLVGGYISYEHLTGNDYKVNLHVFYDCYFAQQGDSMPLCLKSNSLSYDSIIVMYYDTSYVFPYHPCLGSATSCLQGGTNWGMSDNVFSCIVTLPNVASDWRFSVYVRCRNFVPSTVNGFNNAILPVYAYATLDNLNFPFNNSPQFNSNLMPVFCLGVFTINDFNCTDPDGDSLVYEIDSTFSRFPCESDSSNSVEYLVPYSYLNFLDSSSPITMNSATGALSFTPSIIETSIYSVRVDEYRNGLKIGSVKRQEEIIIVPYPTGISFPNHSQDNLYIFPNPTNETLKFTLNNKENISITNLFGNVLIEKNFLFNPNGIVEIDVSILSSGIYFIRAGNDVRRFVKE